MATDDRFKGTYVLIEDPLSRTLKLTLMRAGERLAGPIHVPENSRFFALCCSNPNTSALQFERFGNSAGAGPHKYCLVVFEESRAIRWFSNALMIV
jgi:hypothetical protein